MTSLAEIQAMFRDAVFETGSEQAATENLSRHVNATDGLSSVQHLQIYQRAVMATLERALEQIYPVCRRLVGTDFFGGMARAFIRTHPSRSPDLADFGAEFGEFAAEFEPARGLTYLADVAHLEWAWHRAFNAPDEAPFDPTALNAVSPEKIAQVVFELPASANLLQSEYPVRRIWEVNQTDWSGDQTVDLDGGREKLIIWRQAPDIRIEEIDDAQWNFLRLVEGGATMNELAEIEDLDRMLPDCVQNGWIGGFRMNTDH